MPTRFVPSRTPALVVDRTALDANLSAMQSLSDAAGMRLRPHGKMHKCTTLGRLQIARGAVGLCAQTVGEAEAFVAGGIPDVLVTSPSAAWAAPRIAALARAARIGITADHADQIAWLSEAARHAGVTLDLVVDVDPGNHRTGVDPDGAVALARAAAQAGGLRFAGIQMYAGHIQHVEDRDTRKRAYDDVLARAASIVRALTEAGLPPGVVTGGGTGSHAFDLASGVFTELQAGSYAFMDVEYAACDAPGGGSWPFRQALWVVASVVSANHASQVTVDAGIKAMSTDGPPARVSGGAPAGSTWRPMGDEHGFIVLPDRSPDAPRLGSLVWLQPGHCDPTVNLYDAMYVVAGDGSSERWRIDARRVTP
ncbi:MAG: alanine racemase [Acidobacteriota bacterium]|nr:alanine racemase [Acidobacteriota bacterium]